MNTFRFIVVVGAVLSVGCLAGCANFRSSRGPAPISQYHQESPEWEIRQVPPGDRRFDSAGLGGDGVVMPEATALPVRKK